MSERPLDVLEASIGERISVRLKDGNEFHGILAGYDQHMNIVLHNESDNTIIIRGDNVVSITQ